MVFSGLVTACRLATWPTRRLPSFANATTDGVVRPPSEFVITTGSPPSMTATTELVVPKSIPIILLILLNTPLIYFSTIVWMGVDCALRIICECAVVNAPAVQVRGRVILVNRWTTSGGFCWASWGGKRIKGARAKGAGGKQTV